MANMMPLSSPQAPELPKFDLVVNAAEFELPIIDISNCSMTELFSTLTLLQDEWSLLITTHRAD